MEKLYTASEVGRLLGITAHQVRHLCRAGLCGRLIGRQWVLSEADLAAARARPTGHRGWPRGKKRKAAAS